MNTTRKTTSLKVDITNPGQFYACCGLLELAGRIAPETVAHFSDGHFIIQANVATILDSFFKCDVEVKPSTTGKEDVKVDDDSKTDAHRGRIHPMRLLAPFDLQLDWWTDDEAQEQKLKTWTAGQRVTDLLLPHHKKTKRKGKAHFTRIPSTREHFAAAVQQYPDDWLQAAIPIKSPMTFSYDSRISRNNAIDLGYTDAGILAFSPAVDVLTLVAFQRFRPLMLTQWSQNVFCTWHEPIPVEIAAVAALGVIPQLIDKRYEFPIKRRDSKGRFKLFGHAQPMRSSHA